MASRPRGTAPTGPEGVHAVEPIGEYEVASRLPYFLWSSMPDDELFTLAAKNELRANLDAQVDRMVKDRRSQALVENFAGQWLQTRNLKTAAPDSATYRGFYEPLRQAIHLLAWRGLVGAHTFDHLGCEPCILRAGGRRRRDSEAHEGR